MNFAQFCKQKSIKVIRIHIAKLVELVKQEKYQQLLRELPISLIEVLNLLKESFRWLVKGNYIIKEAHKVLPPYFYNFLKTNLKTKPKLLYQKIIDTNIKKFLKGKPGLNYKDILQHLPKEFCKYIKYFLPKNIDKLPLYQL
jgi:hypothetical protein